MIYDKKIDNLLKRLNGLSQKYHRLSLLFYELSQSLSIQANKGVKYKELSKIVKELNIPKLSEMSNDFKLPYNDKTNKDK